MIYWSYFICFILFVTKGSDDRKELTHKRLYSVARRLTKKSHIRKLGWKLGVKDHNIDSIFCNNKGDITEAAYEILKEWRSGQPNPATAYITLRDALTHPYINLRQVAQEALNRDYYDWKGKQCEVFNMLCDIPHKTWNFESTWQLVYLSNTQTTPTLPPFKYC